MGHFLRRIYFIYAVSFFILTFLILYPFFAVAILAGKSDRMFLAINRAWCLMFFSVCGLRVRVQGKIPVGKKPFVIIANHASYLDIPVLTDVLRFPYAFIGKESLAQVPLFGHMYRNFHILVDRKDRRDRAATLRKAEALLLKGKSVVIFPEGKIDPKGQPKLSNFYDGAFALSKKMQVPILPIALKNNWRILPDDNTFIARAYHPRVEVLPLLQPGDFETADDMKTKAMEVISRAYLPLATRPHGN